MQLRLPKLSKFPRSAIFVISTLVFVTILLRVATWNIHSPDFMSPLSPWLDIIRTEGPSVIGANFANYNSPYLYLMWLFSLIFPRNIDVVKSLALVLDIVLAIGIYKLVSVFKPKPIVHILAPFLALLMPTILFNSAAWGQCDNLLGICVVFALYFVLTKRLLPAWALVGLSFAFKMQGIFLAPFLLFISIYRRKSFISGPLVAAGTAVLVSIPPLFTGHTLMEVLNPFLLGVQPMFGRKILSFFTPNLPVWFPDAFYDVLSIIFIGLAGLACLYLIKLGIQRLPKRLTLQSTLLIAVITLLVIPFLLPQMHERYYYQAEILLITLAIVAPARFLKPAFVLQAAVIPGLMLAFITSNTDQWLVALMSIPIFILIWYLVTVVRDPDFRLTAPLALDRLRRLSRIPAFITFTIIFIIFASISYQRLDPDFGWHYQSGKYFTENGIKQIEPFTYKASDFPWINHEPLSDIITYHLHNLGGYNLLVFVFAILWTFSMWLIYRHSRWRALPVLLLLATIAIAPYAGIRTITWSFLGLAILINLASSPKARWTIPILFVFWANLHGSFLIGLVYLAYLIFYDFVFFKKRKILKPSLILIASFFATFLNPYGPVVYVEIFRTLLDPTLKWTISEWQVNIPFEIIPYLLVFIFIGIFTFKSWRLREYARVQNCFFLAALSTQRHWPLFMLISLEPLSEDARKQLKPLFTQAQTNPALSKVLLAFVAIIVAISGFNLFSIFNNSWDREDRYPTAVVSYLTETPCSGNLFNEYNFGGYLIWKLPSHKVYIDGRGPSWEHNGTKYMRDYEKVFKDPEFRQAEFERLNITCALLYNERELTSELEDSGWTAAISTDEYTLLIQNP